jgi:hypothetical protein
MNMMKLIFDSKDQYWVWVKESDRNLELSPRYEFEVEANDWLKDINEVITATAPNLDGGTFPTAHLYELNFGSNTESDGNQIVYETETETQPCSFVNNFPKELIGQTREDKTKGRYTIENVWSKNNANDFMATIFYYTESVPNHKTLTDVLKDPLILPRKGQLTKYEGKHVEKDNIKSQVVQGSLASDLEKLNKNFKPFTEKKEA